MANVHQEDGRRRAIIESVSPQVDAGRFPIKRTAGEKVVVEADVLTDGHDWVSCVVQYRKEGEKTWEEAAMTPLVNDRWRGEFKVKEIGHYRYTVTAWVDHFLSWRHDLARREQAQDIEIALLVGAQLLEEAAARAAGEDANFIH